MRRPITCLPTVALINFQEAEVMNKRTPITVAVVAAGLLAILAPQQANADVTVFSTGGYYLEPLEVSAPVVVGDTCESRILTAPVQVMPMTTVAAPAACATKVLTHPVTIERQYTITRPAVIDRRLSAPVIIEHEDDDNLFELNTPIIDIGLF